MSSSGEPSSSVGDVSSKLMETLNNRPVSIRLRGLKCMGDTPLNRAQVVYAPPVVDSGSEERLLSACHVIIDAFAEAGLVDKDAKDRLNLKFGSEEWGEYAIREAHLSQKGRFADDYFYCCASVSFPETCK
uniref:A-kinase anchor protein 7-like phosphoesterase domain-containing protein n=1 Tax=Cannabis sativa TaxID=3483 RepID=A0A803NZ37_CANSA